MPKKLLLADDSITIQKVIGITFANEDYELAVVDNGGDAVTKAKEMKPDIILSDVVMPEKDGYQVCKEIKSDPELAHVPVILLTGTFEPFDEAKSKEAGADDYITKPFESQTLIDKVKNYLEKGASAKVAAAPKNIVPSVDSSKPLTDVASVSAAKEEIASMGEEDIWEMTDNEIAPEMPTQDASREEAEIAAEEEIWAMDDFEEVSDVFGETEPETETEEVASISGEDEILTDEGLWDEVGSDQPSSLAKQSTTGEEMISPSIDEEFAGMEFGEEFSGTGDIGIESEEFAAPEGKAASSEDDLFGFDEDLEPEVIIPASATGTVSEEAVHSDEKSAASSLSGISEAKIEQIVSNVAKNIIEKISWEVVPELAETLIKEEIKRLKEHK